MMYLKKFLSVMAFVFVTATISVLFSACIGNNTTSANTGTDTEPFFSESREHIHNFSMWETTTQPSCTNNGMQTRVCTLCGFSEYSPISAFGHTVTTDRAVSPTCTANGLTEGSHCSVCNEVIVAQETISALGHNEETVMGKAATCTEKGLTDGKKCSVCSEVIVAQTEIAVLGHAEEVVAAKAPTCTETGLTEGKKCSVCDAITVAQVEVAALGHSSVVDAAIEATCTTAGKTEGKHCSVCNEVLVAWVEISAKGHTEVSDEAVAPTCLVDGKTAGSHCSVCNTIIIAQAIVSARGHTPITDPAISVTCTTDGKTEGAHCGVCQLTLVEQNTIKAKGHQYDNGVVVSAATCVNEGKRKYTCTVCSLSYTNTYSLPTFTATELYNQSIKYVGEIVVYDKKGVELGLGSGFVYSRDGKIITNYHVIDGAYSATITINNTTYAIKSILAYDENIDLAILKIDAVGLTAATICKNPVQTGETVYAIGSSRGLTNTYSQGIITYADRVVGGVSHIQHDASITHGNSGGPLINVYGEVIGINTWGVSDSQNLNFAVFADEIDNLVYGTPMSLSDFYDLNNNAYDVLLDWLFENYNAYDDTQIRFDYFQGDMWLSLIYDTEGDYLYIDFLTVVSGIELYFAIDFSYDPSQYFYYGELTYNGATASAYGYINAATYTEKTLLMYVEYDDGGIYFDKAAVMEMFDVAAADLVAWFKWAAMYYDMGVTAYDMGFKVF